MCQCSADVAALLDQQSTWQTNPQHMPCGPNNPQQRASPLATAIHIPQHRLATQPQQSTTQVCHAATTIHNTGSPLSDNNQQQRASHSAITILLDLTSLQRELK